jgi:hypothetical protein
MPEDGDRIQSPKSCVFKYKEDSALGKNRTMDSVQKHNICTNVPSSQTFRSYLVILCFAEIGQLMSRSLILVTTTE